MMMNEAPAFDLEKALLVAQEASQNSGLHAGALVKLTTQMADHDENEATLAKYIPMSNMTIIHDVSYNPHSNIHVYPVHFEEWLSSAKWFQLRTFMDPLGLNPERHTTIWPQYVEENTDTLRLWLVQHLEHRAVLLWDGEFEVVMRAPLHWTGKFHLRSTEAAYLTGGGCAHRDEVMTLADGRVVLRTAWKAPHAETTEDEPSEWEDALGEATEEGRSEPLTKAFENETESEPLTKAFGEEAEHEDTQLQWAQEDPATNQLDWHQPCQLDEANHESVEILISSAAPRCDDDEKEDNSEHQVPEVDEHESYLWNAMVEARQAYMAYVSEREKEGGWGA